MSNANAAPGAACNPEAALERLGDDRELYRDVLVRFFADSPAALDRIGGAIEKQDGDELHRASHSYKGLAAMSGTDQLARTAAELEQLGRSNQFAAADDLFTRMKQELASAFAQLSSYYE